MIGETPVNTPVNQYQDLELSSPLRGSNEYLAYLDEFSHSWKDLPHITVDYRNLEYVMPIPVKDPGIPSIPKALLGVFHLCRPASTREFRAISQMSGRLSPGNIYLVLAPPGHGKSLFLKAIAGRLEKDGYKRGEVLYNGQTSQQLQSNGLRVDRLTTYVEQVDIHLPLLTVQETLEFASNNSVYAPENGSEQQRRVEQLIKVLGMSECKDVIAGNQMLRGISGGQRRRLTLGEMMITNARVLCLDEITTGLDSAVAYRVLYALKEWAIRTGGIVVTALLQPTPEVFGLFNEVILLRHGECVYKGSPNTVLPFFDELGLQLPPNTDTADFLNDLLSQPSIVYNRQVDRFGERHPPPPLTTIALKEAFQRSRYYQRDFPPPEPIGSVSDRIRLQYGTSHTYSVFKHVGMCLKRQMIVLKRNKGLIGPRIGQAVIISLVLGSLYFQAGKEEFNKRIGLILFSCIYLAFSNMVEVPWAAEAKNVVYKQCDSNFYPAFAHNFSTILTHFLLVIPETLIFGTIIYFMTGFKY